MKQTRFLMAGILTLVFAASLFAIPQNGLAKKANDSQLMKKEVYKGVPYLSGGVGIGEREHLREMYKNYDLKLMFAMQDGDYLANVGVVVENAKGEKVLDVNSPGPWFYTKLEPGMYTVKATAQGNTVQEAVHVSPTGMTSVIMYWKK